TTAQADTLRQYAGLNAVRDGIFAAAQVSTLGDALKKLLERQNEIQEKFADVQGRYGSNHPEYKKAAAQVSEVVRQIESTRVNIAQRVEREYPEAVNRQHLLVAA